MSGNTRAVAVSPAARLPAWAWLALGALGIAAALGLTRPAAAQEVPDAEPLSAQQLEELVGPIALYPDDLVAIVLPASTYPLQVVEAARFLDAREDDSSLKPDEDWDDSVVALLNYPEVVRLLDDDLDWTWDLGTAVLNQRADVLDAIQGFRDRAYAAGNLRSDDRQVVTDDGGTIAIAPADPEVIYVPYYEPRRVVVHQPVPVYHYYPWGYPVYYYPYPAGYAFSSGFFWGVTSAFAIGWHTHHLHVNHYGYYGHPYYGWRYYDPFYVRSYVNVNVNHGGNVWQPQHRYGGRPVVRGREGRVANNVAVGSSTPNANRGVASSASRYRTRGTAQSGARSQASPTRSYRSANATAGTQRSANSNSAAARPRDYAAGRVRPTQPAQNSRATLSPRAASPSAPGQTARSYRSGASTGARSAAVPPPRTYGGGMSSAARQAPSSAPRATAPSAFAAGSNRPAAATRSGGGGSYRGGAGGGASGGGQRAPATRGGSTARYQR